MMNLKKIEQQFLIRLCVTCIISDVFCPTILTLVNNGVVNLVLDFQFPSALPIDLLICLSLNFSLTCFLLVNQRPGILQNQEFLYDIQWTGYRSFVIYPCNFTITWTIYILFRPLKYASLKESTWWFNGNRMPVHQQKEEATSKNDFAIVRAEGQYDADCSMPRINNAPKFLSAWNISIAWFLYSFIERFCCKSPHLFSPLRFMFWLVPAGASVLILWSMF